MVLFVRDMAKAAAALIDLDGCARRIVALPAGMGALHDWSRRRATRRPTRWSMMATKTPRGSPVELAAPCRLPLQRLDCAARCVPRNGMDPADLRHERTAQARRPHSAHSDGRDRRRAVAAMGDFLRHPSLWRLADFSARAHRPWLAQPQRRRRKRQLLLARFGAAGITHISGTPSHWRKVLMSGEGRRIDPDYVRLSGEIADDAVLGGFAARSIRVPGSSTPTPRPKRASSSQSTTEKPAFPRLGSTATAPCQMKIVDGALRVRSDRCALRFLGADAPRLADKDGFVDTGDMVERRGDRLYFVGRRGGVINVGGAKVHPEEVEAALNAHAAVRASRVFARKSPITGALVFAEVVLRDEPWRMPASEREILAACRARLAPHMAPAGLRFVADLPMTDGGKLARHG